MKTIGNKVPNLLLRCRPGCIQAVVSPEPLALIPALQHSLLEAEAGRLMMLIWQALPAHEQLLNDVLHQMATLALDVWPAWYAGPLTRANGQTPDMDQLLDQEPVINTLQHGHTRLSQPWLKQAAALAREGSPPVLDAYSRTLQCEQLALALDLSDGVILMALTTPHQSDDRLRSLAGVCDWLAQTAKARVFVVVPPELASSFALDSITYQAKDLTPLPGSQPALASPDEETYKLWPVHGQPHPCSPGERLLATRLAADRELNGLFRFNQLVRTSAGSSLLVDLLWGEGKLIVEVDGYRHHSSRQAFCQDRQRDYELMTSGYLVLRLPHSEVVGALEAAIAKIQQFVRFRRQQMPASATSMS